MCSKFINMAKAREAEVEITDDAQSAVSNVTVRSMDSGRAKVVRPQNEVDRVLSRTMSSQNLKAKREKQLK